MVLRLALARRSGGDQRAFRGLPRELFREETVAQCPSQLDGA